MCFGYLARQNLWTEFHFFQHILAKKMKKSFGISFEYLGNDPLSVLKPVVAIIDGWKSHISKYFDNISKKIF